MNIIIFFRIVVKHFLNRFIQYTTCSFVGWFAMPATELLMAAYAPPAIKNSRGSCPDGAPACGSKSVSKEIGNSRAA